MSEFQFLSPLTIFPRWPVPCVASSHSSIPLPAMSNSEHARAVHRAPELPELAGPVRRPKADSTRRHRHPCPSTTCRCGKPHGTSIPQGRLASWPAKPSPAVDLPMGRSGRNSRPGRVSLRTELNRHIRANHLFGDHALLRRELCDQGLLTRTADGRSTGESSANPRPKPSRCYPSSRRAWCFGG